MSGWVVHRSDRPKPYLARFQPKGGRAVSKSFRTKRDAEKWLEVQSVDKTRGEWVDPRRGNITFGDWSARWLAGRRVRPSTLARDESYLRSLILPTLGQRPLNAITTDELREWVADMERSGKSPATVRKAWQIAAQIIGQAAEDGRLARSPLPRRMELPRSERGDLRIPNPDEVALLAETIDERYRVMVLTAAFAGLRFGEAAALRTENVDLLRRSITVAATLSEVRGEVRIGPPKTKRSRRRVAIGRVLADEVGSQVGRFGCDGWIFPAPDGGPLRSSNFRHRVWSPAIRNSGLDGLRFHDLRHAHAAMLIQQGEHPRLISERLGHSSILVTMDVYGSLFPGMDEDAADRLDEVMRSAKATHRSSVSNLL